MGVKEIYSGIEEKYYDLMDGLDKAGIPVYKAIDFIESKSIPSFPVFLILLLALLTGIYFILSGEGILQTTTSFELTVNDGSVPVEDAVITYYVNEEKKIVQTNEDGKAELNVVIGKEFTVSAEKTGFKKETKKFDAEKKSGTIELNPSVMQPIEVQLLGKGNELLEEELTVRFNCSQNNEWNETITVNTGSTQLNDVPADCGTILAEPFGKTCEDCDFTADTSLIKIYLEENETEKGIIDFTVMDKQGNLLNGIEAMALPIGSTIEENSCSTYNGMCSAEVSFGTYYIRTTDWTGKWKDYDSREQTTTLTINSNNMNQEFEIVLEEGIIGEIKIKVKNIEGNPIENALIKLFKDGAELRDKRTDSSGNAIFKVSEQINYSASVTHPDYLNSDSKNVLPSADYFEFVLKEATPSNKRAINVSVVDEKGQPVENTKIFLKDALTLNIVGEEKITGFDGKAVFERVPEGEYIIRAEKRGFEGKDSRKITIKEKEPQDITITLNIGQGTLDVIILDKEKQAIQSATVKVIDYFTGKEYARYSTDTEGKKSFNIRADKKVFLEVNESGHSNYISAPIQMFDGTEEKTIVLEDSINSFAVKLEELKLNGETLEDETVNQGKTYKAVFKLMIPKGVYSNEAGIHIRTGEDTKNQNNTMEKDDLYIKKISAANAKIIKGTTFNPNTGYGIDSSHLTSGNAKWTNVIFNDVQEGVYEIETVIQVKDLLSGSPLEIAYRGWVIDSGYQRDPFDEELQETESTTAKQALYAETRHEPLKIGASSLCSENFCTSFTVRDIANATRTNIVDSFPAKISSNYEIEFNIISINEKSYSNSELAIEGKGLELNSYEIEGIQKNAEGKIIIPTRTISKGQKISGKINFTTKSEGTNRIDFSLFGESLNLGKEKILFNPIRAEVAMAKNMKIETSPKNLLPFIQNNLLVHLAEKQENDLIEATVKIKKDNEIISIGKTDSKGIYAYSFEPLNAGTEIIITAEKAGFNPTEKIIQVKENIVSFMPTEIKETFNAKKPERRITRDITLKNITEMPLTIIGVELTDSFKGLVDAEISDFTETNLLIGSEEQILVNLGLTEKGRKAVQITSIKGEIIIVLENLEAGKQWTASIPIEITIGLGGEVDSPDCFAVLPNEWNVLTEGNARENKFVLRNSCTVEGENIALKNVKAKVVWKENAIGEFTLNPLIEESKAVNLNNSFKVLAETFNPHTEEENLTLRISPDDIPLGSSTAVIYFEAVNPTESGEEILKDKIEVKVQISELSECLRIQPSSTQMRIQMNYYNQGWGHMNQYFAQSPQNTLPYLFNPNTQTTLNRNFPFYDYPYDPNASPGSVFNNKNVVAAGDWRSQQWPHTYHMGQYTNPTAFNPALNYQFGFNSPGKGTIEIRNDCPAEVQIELEGAPEISVSDSTVILEEGGTKTIEVTPTMFVGQYSLIVRAKHKSSTDSPAEIRKYNVLVESEFLRNYYDCISLSKRVFTFNDIIQKPVEGTVWNTCYEQGVVLNYNSIPRDLSGAVNYGFPFDYEQGQKKLGNSGIIDSIEIIQLINRPGQDGKIIQELKFRMRKNLAYRPEQVNLPDADNPLIELANLRIKLTGLYYAVEAEERLPVTFYNRTGTQEIIPFDIIIEDLWGLAGQDIINFGNPETAHQQCIEEGALSFIKPIKNGTNEKGCFEDAVFENGILKIDSQTVIKKSKQFCGDTDRISRIINNKIELDSGIILLFSVENGDQIKVNVDKRNMTCNPGKIENTLYLRLSRANPAETRTVSIPYEICLDIEGFNECTEKPLTPEQEECKAKTKEGEDAGEKIKEITDDDSKDRKEKIRLIILLLKEICDGLTEDQIKEIAEYLVPEETPAEMKACEQGGFTGETAFKKYGFDKIKLDWDWDNISAEECDTGKTYCDSTQLGIELTKKAERINELKTIELDDLCQGYCEEDVKDSKNLFRFLINQTKIKDDITEKEFVFFVNKNNSIIAGKKFNSNELTGNLTNINLIAEWLEGNLSGNAKTVNELVDDIITEIENNSELNEESIIGEIDSSKIDKEKFIDIGGDLIERSTTKYAITFNEYKAFRNKLKACIKLNEKAEECEINKVKNKTTGTTGIDISFMKNLQENIEFKVGIRNIKEISEEEKTKIMKEGKTRISEVSSLEEFYNENIEFEVYLKADGLTDDFKEDFESEYPESKEHNFKEWEFKTKKPNKSFESGKHKIVLNYSWADKRKNTETELNLEEKLGSFYAENYLFKIPFDGKTGVNEFTQREGYGTEYGLNSSVNDIYLTSEINLKENKSGVNTAFKKLTDTEKKEKFAETRNAGIIYISETEFEFTPSKAIGLKAGLASAGQKGVFYDLIKGAKEDEDKRIGLSAGHEKELNYLFEWIPSEKKDSKQKESQLNNTSECKSERFGVIFSSGAEETQKVLSFVPVNWAYTFAKHCNKGITEMKGYAFDYEGTAEEYSLPETTTFSSEIEPSINSKTSIKKWITDIKSENVCFETNETEFSLEWNKTKLMKEIN